MDRLTLLEKLAELKSTKNKLNEKLADTISEINAVEAALYPNLEGRCFKRRYIQLESTSYYKVTKDTGDDIDFVYISDSEHIVKCTCNKLDFVQKSNLEEISRTDFDEILDNAYNYLKEL